MRLLIAFASCIALAACTQAEAPEADDATEETAAAETVQTGAGLYEATAADGTTMQSRLNEDGTYQDTGADGAILESGTWKSADNRTCFDPEGDKAEYCFTDGERAEDGSFTATPDEGEAIMVRPVTEVAAE